MNPIRPNTLLTIAVALCLFSGITSADCGGVMTRQPVRTLIRNVQANQPVRSALQRVVQPVRTSSCSGTVSSVECTSYENTVAKTVVSCVPTRSVMLESTVVDQVFVSTGVTPVYKEYNVDTTFGLEQPQQTFGLDSYSRALASAQYRAANGIKGHVQGELLSNRASSAGVGFATNNPNPRTCLGVPGRTTATCAVVKGPDGWYSTCVRP